MSYNISPSIIVQFIMHHQALRSRQLALFMLSLFTALLQRSSAIIRSSCHFPTPRARVHSVPAIIQLCCFCFVAASSITSSVDSSEPARLRRERRLASIYHGNS
ncbi:hypothetical protein BT69DRAFT_167118 [Atractiella rhizophila]|nr:hypothetical protein BT69DRAFT_167118 [Atractiella rhizophila]